MWLVSALSRADAMLLEQDGYDTNKGKSGRSSKNKNRNKKKHRPYGKEITYYQALQHLCGGYYKVSDERLRECKEKRIFRLIFTFVKVKVIDRKTSSN